MNKINKSIKKKISVTNIILILIVLIVFAVELTGCDREANMVSYNVSKDADNFNVLRRFAVINTRTDKVEFELIGAFSLNDESENGHKVYVIVEKEDGTYLKHIIGLNEDTFYVVEDLGGAKVNKYKYEINYVPESIVPFTVTETN